MIGLVKYITNYIYKKKVFERYLPVCVRICPLS